MSQWTHVNGSIRFDSILGMGKITIQELGRIVKYDDESYSTILPCGSEGSIEYKIVNTGTENSVANQVVVFAGDLRDYSDVDEIIKYFNKISEGKIIRSGIIEIDVEYQDAIVIRYVEDKFVIV